MSLSWDGWEVDWMNEWMRSFISRPEAVTPTKGLQLNIISTEGLDVAQTRQVLVHCLNRSTDTVRKWRYQKKIEVDWNAFIRWNRERSCKTMQEGNEEWISQLQIDGCLHQPIYRKLPSPHQHTLEAKIYKVRHQQDFGVFGLKLSALACSASISINEHQSTSININLH